jgi:hypothetical protein
MRGAGGTVHTARRKRPHCIFIVVPQSASHLKNENQFAIATRPKRRAHSQIVHAS